MKTIVLTGMMGSGKSSVSKVLSNITGYKLFDIDELIEKKADLTISQIFQQKGEEFFRELEKNTILEIFTPENSIISLGGGAFENEQIRNFLLTNALVFFLFADAQTLFDRVKSDTSRPLLNNNMNIENLRKILNTRIKNYRQAHFTINTENRTIEDISHEILLEAKWKN